MVQLHLHPNQMMPVTAEFRFARVRIFTELRQSCLKRFQAIWCKERGFPFSTRKKLPPHWTQHFHIQCSFPYMADLMFGAGKRVGESFIDKVEKWELLLVSKIYLTWRRSKWDESFISVISGKKHVLHHTIVKTNPSKYLILLDYWLLCSHRTSCIYYIISTK